MKPVFYETEIVKNEKKLYAKSHIFTFWIAKNNVVCRLLDILMLAAIFAQQVRYRWSKIYKFQIRLKGLKLNKKNICQDFIQQFITQ